MVKYEKRAEKVEKAMHERKKRNFEEWSIGQENNY